MKFVQIENGSYVNANRIIRIYIDSTSGVTKEGIQITCYYVKLLFDAGYTSTYKHTNDKKEADDFLAELIKTLEG